VVIYAYQHHVRLLPSEPVVVMQPKCTVEGADIVMQSGPRSEINLDGLAVSQDLGYNFWIADHPLTKADPLN